MKKNLWLALFYLIISGNVLAESCDINFLTTLNYVSEELFNSLINNFRCLEKYGNQVCIEQAKTISKCIDNNNGQDIEGDKYKCRIGLKISVSKEIALGEIKINEIEQNLYDEKFLSKILGSKVVGKNGHYQNSKPVPFPLRGEITNEIKIQKLNDEHFQIISNNYNQAFILSKINLKIENKKLKISSETYVKQSTADIPFSQSIIRSGIGEVFSRLVKEIEEK